MKVADASITGPRGENSMRLLSRVQAGMAVRVKRLLAGPEMSQRLREMGVGEEMTVRLVARQSSIICQVRNARLAFSEKLAELILVEPIEQPTAS